jgi:putative chitinase
MLVTQEQLRAIMPSAPNFDPWIDPFNATLEKFEINTPLRMAHFIAQCAHESGSFNFTVESLYYPTPEQLMSVWPSIFKTKEMALPYVKNEEKLGNFIYANRMGNDETCGFKYRGKGLIQLTGKSSQIACAKFFEVDEQIAHEWLETIKGACGSAGWFWQVMELNKLADNDSLDMETRIINGGNNGMEDRRKFLTVAKKVLGV